jgi:hypothetical protein
MYNILYAIQAMVGRGPSGHPANDSLPADREGTADSVERLMGTKAEARFAFHLRQGRIRQRPAGCVILPLAATFGRFPAFSAGKRLNLPVFRAFSGHSFSGSCVPPATAFWAELRIVTVMGFGNRVLAHR